MKKRIKASKKDEIAQKEIIYRPIASFIAHSEVLTERLTRQLPEKMSKE